MKGPQVAVVFARSGSKGLQGSGNTETIIRDQRYRIDTDAGLTQVTTVKNADAGLIFWLDNVVQSHLWDL